MTCIAALIMLYLLINKWVSSHLFFMMGEIKRRLS